MAQRDELNESQPVCPRCGADECLCGGEVDWEALRQDACVESDFDTALVQLPPVTERLQ